MLSLLLFPICVLGAVDLGSGKRGYSSQGWDDWTSKWQPSSSSVIVVYKTIESTLTVTEELPSTVLVTATETIPFTKVETSTLTSTVDITTTVPKLETVTSTVDITTTITKIEGTPICGSGTTIINSYITTEIFPNVTCCSSVPGPPVTVTTTETITVTSLVPVCGGGGGGGGNGSVSVNVTAIIVALEDYLSTTFMAQLNASLTEILDYNLNETIEVIENTPVQLSNVSLTYINNTIGDLIFGVFADTFNDGDSNYYGILSSKFKSTISSTSIDASLSEQSLLALNQSIIHAISNSMSSESSTQIISAVNQSNPWYAIVILVLLILFGLLCLAALAYLILKRRKHKKRKGGENCETCGYPVDQCICPREE